MQSGSPLTPKSINGQRPVTIPTTHELLGWQEVEAFEDWLEPELQDLEERFRQFWTPSSFKKSLSR